MRPTDNDQQYFREREAQERQAAQRSSCIVRGVHEELAELYAAQSGGSEASLPPPRRRKEL